jgi:glutathione S-transferase
MRNLKLQRTFDAPAQAVFAAWTDPEVLRRWWTIGEDWTAEAAEVDLRVGGGYRLTMRDAGGTDCTVVGEYLRIEPPERLVHTRRWAGEDAVESVVDVRFEERDGRTTVRLEHTGLATETSREAHERGWNACLDTLGGTVLAASAGRPA